MPKKPDIRSTIDLIARLHKGQSDQTGHPYVAHPLRVAENLQKIYPLADEDMIMAALLHDTIEDCGIETAYLRKQEYSDGCITMVSLLSKPENDPRSYDEVIDDLIASGNRGTMFIKMADNMDNLHPQRIANLAQANPERAERLAARYERSIEKLCIATGLDTRYIMEMINKAPALGSQQKPSEMKEEFMAQTYKYYLLGDTVPVRVAFNDKGMKMGAEVPNSDKGELVQDATYLSRLERSFEVEKITEEQFRQRAEEMLGKSL